MRLIDAAALIKTLKRTQSFLKPETYEKIIKGIVINAIEKAPTINQESLIPHGRWEKIDDCCGDYHWRCLLCGIEWVFEADGPAENGANYCPNCGAKMEDNDESV